MAEKVEKLFSEYEKGIRHKKKDVDDNRSVNREGGGEYPPPSPSLSDSSHQSNQDSKPTSKKPFFNLDEKFDLSMYNGECSAEKLNNWIRQIEVYYQIQEITEDEAKVQLASLWLSGITLVWWERKLYKASKKLDNLLPFWSNFISTLKD